MSLASIPRIVITDLDGTLLDHDTYSFAEARPALEALREREIPLAIVSSKSRAEIRFLRAQLGVAGPDIPENGAASRSYEWICAQLRALAAQTGIPVRGFHQMTDAELAQLAGLPVDSAARARRKEFSEAFQILDPRRIEELTAAIEAAGLRWTRGGRFYHLFEQGSKGEAVAALLPPGADSLGLGDAWNDLPFLKLVRQAVICRSPREAELLAALPGAVLAPRAGPAGWSDAVLTWLACSPPPACPW